MERASQEESVQYSDRDSALRRDDRSGTSHTSTGRVRPSRGKQILVSALLLALVVSTVAMFGPVVDEAIGGFALLVMLVLIFLRVPVGVALIVPGLLGMWAIAGFDTVAGALTDMAYNSVAKWSLGVVPMFVFMGLILWQTGVTESLYLAARRWLGWLPGGLAIGTNFAGAGLAAVSGSTTATSYALGRSGIPEMLKAGYHPRMAIAPVIAAGLPGQLIPPSILLVIYAGIAEVSVGPQLLAGIGPGILVALLFAVAFAVIAARQVRKAGTETAHDEELRTSWRQRWRSLFATWPVPIIILLILGGMFSGLFTATEAASVAALFSIVIAFLWRGRRAWKGVVNAAVGTVSTTGAIFLLLIGANALSLMLTISGVSEGLAELVTSWNLGRTEFLLIMIVIYLIMGMFMDPLAMMLLTVPILIPVLEELGVSLLLFGVFAVFMGELAVVTPPVGILAYIIHGMVQEPEVNLGRNISLRDVFGATLWILPVAILMVLLIIFFPDIVTFIPSSMMK